MVVTLLSLFVRLVDLYSIIIFVYVLMSWLPTDRGLLADIYSVLGKVCEPYLGIFRKFIPPIGGMLDVSPIVALLVLQFAVRIVVRLVAFVL